MNKQLINGKFISCDASFEKLLQMLQDSDMQWFAYACETLSRRTDDESFNALQAYLVGPDKYKRLRVLYTIFNHPCSYKVIGELENALTSSEVVFVNAALSVIIKKNLHVSDEKLLAVFEKNIRKLSSYEIQALNHIRNSYENMQKLIALLETKYIKNGPKAALAEIMYFISSPEQFEMLFPLFANDEFGKVRLIACKLAIKHGHLNLLDGFLNDIDGHVRKQARIAKEK
jgi:hypothetical protein